MRGESREVDHFKVKKMAAKKTAVDGKEKALRTTAVVRVGIRVVACRKVIANKVDYRDKNRELTPIGRRLLEANPRDDTNFLGRVARKIGGNKKNWRIKFDEFPRNHDGVVLRREAFKTLEEGEDVL